MKLKYLWKNSLRLQKQIMPFYIMLTLAMNYMANDKNNVMYQIIHLGLLWFFLNALLLVYHYTMETANKVLKFLIILASTVVSLLVVLWVLYLIAPESRAFLYWEDNVSVPLRTVLLVFNRYLGAMIFAGFIYYHIRHKNAQEELWREKEAKYQQEIEMKDLLLVKEREARALEVGFLSAQMHPHFLHNTLNNMVGAAYPSNPGLAAQLTNLSYLVRYKLESTKNENAIMDEAKEIEALNAYLEIMKWQQPHADIRFSTDGQVCGQRIVPAVLLDRVENMFTHGMYRKGVDPIVIQRKLTEGHVGYYLKNKIDPQSQRKERNGIGLINCRRRLELLFADKYQLNTWVDDENCFNVDLILYQY
ncbi:Histidine kinase [Sphingobacterium nematocida]|uniref:Histidine kinase n=1 Tax=Sphingobacterium nematocida TaxID=1513896 RepID=A0A1T5ASN0_9SPHI|nr:histidine kinase [Sphingobacterium nematocida]SKB38034.1 Histidine kinase [Sphingobacterium nematocida]